MQGSILKCISIIWAVLLLNLFASAEPSSAPAVLSLQDCVDIAMKNQIDVLSAQNNIEISRDRALQAQGSYFPQVSIQNNAFVLGSTGVLNSVSTGAAVSASMNIFDGGVRETGTQSAWLGVKASKAGFSRTVQTVVYNVTQAYYEYLRSKHLVDVAEASVKYNEGLREQVQERAKAGAAAPVDVLPVEAQLASAQVDLLSAQNTMHISAIDLESAMGLAPQPGFDVSDVTSEPKVDILPEKAYIDMALADRPDIAQRKASASSARASETGALLNMLPRPVVTGTVQNSLAGGFTKNSAQVVGGFALNIFDGGISRAAYREARANRRLAQQQADQITKEVSAQVESAYLNLTSSQKRIAAAQVGLDSAKKNYEVQREKYSQGLGTTLDLLNAEVQLTKAQSNLVQARYDYYVAIAQMDYSVGMQGGFNAK